MGIKPMSVKEIVDKNVKFIVPGYQRGYRWTEKQVKDLLNDLWEFSEKEGKGGEEFYCLQPIVVKNMQDNKYEVVDGQQRLTTIYMILKLLGEGSTFSIIYETRKRSEDFLEKINRTTKEDESNIDFYYMSRAYLCIKEWFDKHCNGNENKEAKKNCFLNRLLRESDDVKFIWYKVDEHANGAEIFTRINLGKIPLTNAELIKALFLKRSNFNDKEKNEKIRLRQLEIANEWDNIEYALQNDEFWYFLNKEENSISTRIEFIFDLIADEVVEEPENFLREIDEKIGKNNDISKEVNQIKHLRENKKDDYWTFAVFNELFEYAKGREEIVMECLWEKIKSTFLTLQDWFNDRELYHKIGFLVTVGEKKIKKLVKETREKSKSDFKDNLNNWIKDSLKLSGDRDLEELVYGEDDSKIKNILLLFNIMTLLRNSESSIRFSFDKFKKEKWSLEHIHARNSERLRGKQLIAWLESHKRILENIKESDSNKKNKIEKAIQKIEEIRNKIERKKKMDDDEVNEIQNEIFNILEEDKENKENSVENLALLSVRNNSYLSNSVFAVKREKIIELDKEGSFIPICTKNVFLKYYTKNPSSLYFWSKDDRKDYLKAIKKVLKDYLDKNVKKEYEDE